MQQQLEARFHERLERLIERAERRTKGFRVKGGEDWVEDWVSARKAIVNKMDWPEKWPSGGLLGPIWGPLTNTLAWTPNEALALLSTEGDRLVELTARGLLDWVRALVAEELQEAVLQRSDVLQRWPWFLRNCQEDRIIKEELDVVAKLSGVAEAGVAKEGLKMIHWAADPSENPHAAGNAARFLVGWGPRDEPGFSSGPDVAVPIDKLIAWLKRHTKKGAALATVEQHAPFFSMPAILWRGPPFVASLGALSLLYRAEQQVAHIAPAPPTYGILDVGTTTARTLTSLGGGDVRGCPGKGEDIGLEWGTASLVFKWGKGQKDQLELPWDSDLLETPFRYIGERFGKSAVRDLLAVYIFLWASRTRAKEGLWWWPQEHLERCDLKNTKENRRRLAAVFDNLHQAELTVRFPEGEYLKGPILATVERSREARLIRLHSALYSGVRDEEGSMGNRWWWCPQEVLKQENIAGVMTAPAFGYLFRGTLGEGRVRGPARERVGRLAQRLAIRWRNNRQTDGQVGERVRTALEAGVAAGTLGRYTVEGAITHRDSVVSAWPGEGALQCLERRGLARVAPLPATGADVADWIKRGGESVTSAAELLDVNPRTLRRAIRGGNAPIPYGLRSKFRAFLWRDAPTRG